MNKEILKLTEDLSKLNKSFLNDKNRIVSKNEIFKSKFLYFYYLLNSEFIKKTPFKDILINYFNKSEKLYPGSSYYTSVKFLNKIFNVKHTVSIKTTEKKLETLLSYLEEISSEESFLLLKNVLFFSGPDAIINCELTKNKSILVEKKCKPEYKINIHESFKEVYFKNSKSSTKNYKISIFDGFIERESELIPFIEELHKDKIPGIILCRGISEIAVTHLKQILLKNRIYLYPYVSKLDNKDPFLFKDISKNLNTEVVSSDFYDNVYKDIVRKSVDKKVTLEKNKIIFEEKNNELIEEINNQIKNCNNDAAKEYLRKRKKRSSPNNITIYIPNDKLNLLNELKSLIYCYNFCVRSGFVLVDNEIKSLKCETVSNNLSEKLYQTINSLGLVIKKEKSK